MTNREISQCDSLLEENIRLRNALTELKNIAATVSNHQHCGVKVSAREWSDLYAAINLAKAALS